MKVILNKDLAVLGEEGDVKDVARGYARNFLFPRGIALPYNEGTIKLFEARRDEIEARKGQKRQDAQGLKERLEALEINISLPAGPNGKLYGAVTSQTVADELAKLGFQIEKKRLEVPGNHIKNVGKFRIAVRLYENTQAELNLDIQGQLPVEEKKAPREDRRRDRRPRQGDAGPGEQAAEVPAGEAPAASIEEAPVRETPAPDAQTAESPAPEAAAPPAAEESPARAAEQETPETVQE
jgi:large subunit ribosomal protein L9